MAIFIPIGLIVLLNIAGIMIGLLALVAGTVRVGILSGMSFGKVETTRLFKEVSSIRLSPNRDKGLYYYGGDFFVMDIKSEETLFKGPVKGKSREIVLDNNIGWVNNEEILFVIKDYRNEKFEEHITKDLVNFTKIPQVKNGSQEYSNSYKKSLYLSENDKTLIIKYENGELWDTNLIFDRKHVFDDWSNDDKFVFISAKKTQYLINTENKRIFKMTEPIYGEWAPTKNVYFTKGRLFYPETMKFLNLRLNNINDGFQIGFHWSPDSRYILIKTSSETYILDTNCPKEVPKHLFRIKGCFDEEFSWSADMKSVFFLYHNTGFSILKPVDFYVAKVDIATGKTKKLFIDGLLYHGFYWVDDNTIYYEIDHTSGLFKSKLKW